MNAMSNTVRREEVGDYINFIHIPDPKFKHNLITVNFIMPLDAKTASDNAVVPYILRKGTRECPDFSEFNAKLNRLYGATMSAGVSKINSWQIISVSIRALDNRFALDGEDIAGECAALLAAVTLDPKLSKDGYFDAKDTELEKQFVIDTIHSEINEKRSYAILRCMQEMCKGEPVSVRKYGDLDTADAITPESAFRAYRVMLENACIEISFTGRGNPDSTKEIFSEAFKNIKRNAPDFSLTQLKSGVEKISEHTESMELSQSKLVMGFRCARLDSDEKIFAMRMCSAILGGTPFSKFFLNVREKLSLCYYCAASFDQYNKLLIVDSGIESANKQKTREEILRQLEAVKNGEITDEELANTKLLVSNMLTTSTDSPSSMELWYLSQFMKGRNRSPEQEIEMLAAITKDQIVEAAKNVALDTVYFLTGGDDSAE